MGDKRGDRPLQTPTVGPLVGLVLMAAPFGPAQPGGDGGGSFSVPPAPPPPSDVG